MAGRFRVPERDHAALLWRLFLFGVFASLVCGTDWIGHHRPELEVGITPYEVAGAALGLLLVLRTNAGYERWWEGRKLWGGIVNQCRQLGIVVLSYGPEDPAWRDRGVRLVAAFAHVTRRSLRGEREIPEVAALLGTEEADRIAAVPHMPGYIALRLADHFRAACDQFGMDRFAFLEADRDLGLLLDRPKPNIDTGGEFVSLIGNGDFPFANCPHLSPASNE